MDIVTHALMGAVIAGPALATAPLTASCFIMGSVLPDLDAFSRCFGKQAFLRWHQTYTHGVPVIALAGIVTWMLIPRWTGEPLAALALAAGMALHVGLDLSNTYGTAALSPLSARRWCMEWVFFVDGAVVVLSVVAALLQWRSFTEAGVASVGVAIGYTLMLAAYWTPRAILRARASRCSPAGTRSLIPSAVIPWRYFGCAGEGKNILLFRINALTGAIDQERRQLVLDDEYSAILGTASEYRIMRQLSPAYHVVQASPVAEGIEVTCRDLRTRNFGGRFGELIVTLDENGQIVRKELNV